MFFIIFSLFFNNSLAITLIHPAKIKNFLEYQGKKHKVHCEYDEYCENMLWNYAEYKKAPWSIHKMCVSQDYETIREKIKKSFNKLAEDNKKLLKNKMLCDLTETETQKLIYNIIYARNINWRTSSEIYYTQEAITHFATISEQEGQEDTAQIYNNITNGYELIKALGCAVASYYDKNFMQKRNSCESCECARPNETNKMGEKELDYFVLINKNTQDNTLSIISLPGYNQNALYKNIGLFESIEKANWLKKKDKSAFSYRWKLFLCTIPALVRFFTMAPGVKKKYEGIKQKMASTNKVLEKQREKSEKIKKCYET